MLIGFRDLLERCRAEGAAAGAFTCYNGETALGVIRAAEAQVAPAILLVSEGSLRSRSASVFLPMLRAAAEHADVPVCVELDHVKDVRLARAGLEAGASAVMADGSGHPFEENVAFVQAVAKEALRYGADVEAELGRIEGDEDVDRAVMAGQLTDPQLAGEFVRASGAACLAVSIGNVHGRYSAPPELDWKRLASISSSVPEPLSLHGASGLSSADLRRAVALGISKVNFNTEIRTRVLLEMESQLPQIMRSHSLLELSETVVEAVAKVAAAKLELLSTSAKEAVP